MTRGLMYVKCSVVNEKSRSKGSSDFFSRSLKLQDTVLIAFALKLVICGISLIITVYADLTGVRKSRSTVAPTDVPQGRGICIMFLINS